MKHLLLLLLLLPLDGGRFIKGKGFEGYIFPKEHFVMVPAEGGRFTPNDKDVIKAETLLKQQIALLNKEQVNQVNGEPVIHKKLNKYIRQYIGYYNNKHEQIIYINCVWKHDRSKDKFQKDIISVHDGGSYYWNVKANLDTGELYELYINGLG